MVITIRLLTRKNKEQKQLLQVRIRDGRQKEIAVYPEPKIYVYGKYWDGENLLTEKHPDFEILNNRIIEIKNKIETAKNKYKAGKLKFYDIKYYLEGKKDTDEIKTLDAYLKQLEKKVGKTLSQRNYISKKENYKQFKKNIGINRKISFEEISNSTLFEKYYEKASPKLTNKQWANRTYKNYINSVFWILNQARESGKKIDIPFVGKHIKSPNIKGKSSPNKKVQNSTISDVIKDTDSIERWQAVAMWLLQFGLRGIGNSDIATLTEDIIVNKQAEPAATNYKAHINNELYFDYGRSKNGRSMFIRLFPSVKRILEKLKYSYIYTSAGTIIDGNDIIVGLKDKYSVIKYIAKNDGNKHNNLFKNRTKLFKEMGYNIDFSMARNTFIQTAKKTTNYNTGLVNILVGQTIKGDTVLDNHYLNYQEIEEIDRVEIEHKKVLDDFKFDALANYLIHKLKELVENKKCPKWVLKQSAVISNRVAVDYQKGKGVEWVEIEGKYRKYFNDPSVELDYWNTEEKQRKKQPIKYAYQTDKQKELIDKLLQENKAELNDKTFVNRYLKKA